MHPHLDDRKPEPASPFRRPRSRLVLLTPLVIIFVMVLAVLDMALWQKAGVSVIAVASVVIALAGGRKRLDSIEFDVAASESALRQPAHARSLNFFEPWLYIGWAVVMTPTLSRLLARTMTSGKGELGFGGILFLVGGFAIALVVAGSAIVIQRHYVQDDYRIRWLVNLSAIAVAVYVMAT